MEQTIQALGAILLKSIFTVCALVVLHFYLKVMLFAPLEKTLKQRDALTGGARKDAEASLANADRKQQEYEAKFRDARAEVYRAQEETRRGWLEDQTAQIAEARQRSEVSVRSAKEQITADATAARQSLGETSATLADQIATTVLARRAQ
jgi:F-type H+-transporting ATPase subunit b